MATDLRLALSSSGQHYCIFLVVHFPYLPHNDVSPLSLQTCPLPFYYHPIFLFHSLLSLSFGNSILLVTQAKTLKSSLISIFASHPTSGHQQTPLALPSQYHQNLTILHPFPCFHQLAPRCLQCLLIGLPASDLVLPPPVQSQHLNQNDQVRSADNPAVTFQLTQSRNQSCHSRRPSCSPSRVAVLISCYWPTFLSLWPHLPCLLDLSLQPHCPSHCSSNRLWHLCNPCSFWKPSSPKAQSLQSFTSALKGHFSMKPLDRPLQKGKRLLPTPAPFNLCALPGFSPYLGLIAIDMGTCLLVHYLSSLTRT